MKTFDEFKKSLTKKDVDYINQVGEEPKYDLQTSLEDPNALDKIGGLIAARSFTMGVRLLELYHEWLSEQL